MGYDTYKSGELTIRGKVPEDVIVWFKNHETADNRTCEGQDDCAEMPGYYLGWNLREYEDHCSIDAEDHERCYDWIEQLVWLIGKFFMPNNLVLNGDVYWDGEDSEDLGVVRVRNNVVHQYQVDITYPGGPDWVEPPVGTIRAAMQA